MKNILTVILTILITLAICGCNENRDVREIFYRAGQLMDTHPDSALLLLKDIESKNLITNEGKARYALLLSQAYDKSYIDLTNDSLINIAVEYYADSNDKERYFTSLYYLARVQYNAGLYTKSMLTIIQAEELASEIKDKYKLGLMYAYKGKIYSSIYDPEKSIPEYMSAIKNYRLANKDLLEHDLLLNVADAYFKIKNYEKAEKCIKESIEWAYKNKNENLLKNAVNTLILMYDNLKEHTKIKDLYKSKYFKIYNSDVVINLSLALYFAYNEKKDSTIYYLNKAEEFVSTSNDTILLYNRAYIAYKRLKDYENALLQLEKERKYGDYLMRTALKQPVVTAERDYFEQESLQVKENAAHNKKIFTLSTIILASFICILLLVVLYYYEITKRKNAEIVHTIEAIHDVNNIINNQKREIETTQQQIAKVFSSQFALLDELVNTYLDHEGSNRVSAAVLKEVEERIAGFRNQKKLDELKKVVNENMNNIADRLMQQITTINNNELILFLYLCAQFSPRVITLFMSDKLENIYNKKSRLKRKIQNSNATDKEEFLRLF